MTEQFVEYLTILGYLNLDSLPIACTADLDIRNKLVLECCYSVMRDIFGDGVDIRDSHTIRKHLNKIHT